MSENDFVILAIFVILITIGLGAATLVATLPEVLNTVSGGV